MKKLTLMIAAILFCGSVFTSCKKDPSGSGSGTSSDKKLVEVRVNQSLTLSSSSNDALNRAYNVKVIYFDAGKAGFRLIATPKSDLSGVAEDEKFDINGTFKFTIVAKYSNGTTENLKEANEGIAYTGLRPYNGRVIKSLRSAYQIDQNGKLQAIEIDE